VIVSLSHPIDGRNPVWPGDPAVTLEPVADLAHDGYCLRRLSFGEHSGTHVNTPGAFFSDGKAVADYPPAHWLRPGVCLHLRTDNPDDLLTRERLDAWEADHGPIPPGAVVLLDTGWARFWSDHAKFLGDDGSGRLHFPGFDPECARFLLDERLTAGLGVDTHGLDGGLDDTFAVNRMTLARDGIVLECLANLERLPAAGFTLVIGVLPIVGGGGAPAQVFAFV
jgi:kynurenine formamidase